MKVFSKEHGYVKLSPALTKLLLEIRATAPSRYSINLIGGVAGKLAATDGRRLLEVTLEDESVADGLYYLTADGFLLPTEDERKFPEYTEIMPKKGEYEKVGEQVNGDSMDDDRVMFPLLKNVFESELYLDMGMLLPALRLLSELKCFDVQVWRKKEEYKKSPLLVQGNIRSASFRYVQMPLDGNRN